MGKLFMSWSTMVAALLLFGDDHALVGDAGAPGVLQDHRGRLPVAPGLYPIHRRRMAEGIVGPVMPQVVWRERWQAHLLAQHAHTIVEAIAGNALATVAQEEGTGGGPGL